MGYQRESVSQSKQLKKKDQKKKQKFKKTTHPMETLGASRSRRAIAERKRVLGECQDGDRSASSAKWPNGCFNCWLAFQVESCVYSPVKKAQSTWTCTQ